MKVLLLNSSDTKGGAAIATYRLHQGFKRIGLDSTLLVQKKESKDFTVIGPESNLHKVLALVRPDLDWLLPKLYWHREKQIFSTGIVPDLILSKLRDINPDIVHLFWVNAGFMRIETLRKINKPIVWTLHDMWPITGGCHYDGECGKYRQSCGTCPVLHSSLSYDLSHHIWKRKHRAWANLNITVVATSQWLAECAKSSSLFGNYRIEVLPNGIDEEIYKPIDKNIARSAYNLPCDKQLILFSAFAAVNDPRKGFQYLIPALRKMADEGWGKQVELVMKEII